MNRIVNFIVIAIHLAITVPIAQSPETNRLYVWLCFGSAALFSIALESIQKRRLGIPTRFKIKGNRLAQQGVIGLIVLMPVGWFVLSRIHRTTVVEQITFSAAVYFFVAAISHVLNYFREQK